MYTLTFTEKTINKKIAIVTKHCSTLMIKSPNNVCVRVRVRAYAWLMMAYVATLKGSNE